MAAIAQTVAASPAGPSGAATETVGRDAAESR